MEVCKQNQPFPLPFLWTNLVDFFETPWILVCCKNWAVCVIIMLSHIISLHPGNHWIEMWKKFLYSDSLKKLATSQWNILWQFSFLTCRLETVCVFLKTGLICHKNLPPLPYKKIKCKSSQDFITFQSHFLQWGC